MAPPASAVHPAYEAISLTFHESMAGRLQPTGRPQSELASFEVEVHISSLGAFLSEPNHAARLSGTVTYPPLGARLRIEGGQFHLLSTDPGHWHAPDRLPPAVPYSRRNALLPLRAQGY